MTQQQRFLVAIGLSFGLIIGWQLLFEKPRIDAEMARLAAIDAGVQAELAARAAAAAVFADGGTTEGAMAQFANDDGGLAITPIAAALPVRTVELFRPTMRLRFTSEGAGLESAELQGTREHVQRSLSPIEGYQKLFGTEFAPGAQMNMAAPSPSAPPQLGVSMIGPWPLSGRQRYAVTEELPGRVVFIAHEGPWEVTKTFTWNNDAKGLPDKVKGPERDPTGYEFQLDVSLKNTSQQLVTGNFVVHLNRGIDPASEKAPSMFGGIGNQSLTECLIADTLHTKTPDDEKPELEEKGQVHFVALDQQYFVSAVWPKDGPFEGRCVLHSTTTGRLASLEEAVTVAPGQTLTKRYGSFMGPKDLELLAQVGAGSPYVPKLDKTVDFGWWAVICRMLLFFLKFFHGLLGNWGLAIILLTVMVKVVLLPLTQASALSGGSEKAEKRSCGAGNTGAAARNTSSEGRTHTAGS